MWGVEDRIKDTDMKRISIFALGLMLFVHQTMGVQMVRAAQLSLGSGSDIETEFQNSSGVAEGQVVGLSPNQDECDEAKPSQSSELNGQAQPPAQSGTGVNYQASTETVDANGQLVAQQPMAEGDDDCCEVSGNSLCEVAGLPPVGGAGLLASPLLALAGLPLAAIPFLAGDGDDESGPGVPEPSTTAGLVVGLGAAGLLLSRRRKHKS